MKKTEPAIIAKKYAKALFQVAKENNQIERLLTEFGAVSQISSKENLISLIDSPDGKAIWFQFLGVLEGKISAQLKDFLNLLSEMGRESLVLEIYKQFVAICDSHFDVARGILVTASKIDVEQIESMQKIVTEKIGKKVIFEHRHDPSILGGVVAQVGGWTFDDSLRTQLNKISQVLAN
jgi:F-type H+-transporting ATPase subunit delta